MGANEVSESEEEDEDEEEEEEEEDIMGGMFAE